MKKNVFACLIFILCGISQSFSQDYKTGIGLRGGWTTGLTGKFFIKEGKAIEGILSSGYAYRGGWQLTGLYEVHKPAFTKDDLEGFFWFYGGGIHFSSGHRYRYWYPGPGYGNGYYETRYYSTFGIDGIFGLEYKISEVPITIGLDVKPFIEFATYNDYPFNFWDAAFTIRFVF